MKKRSIAALLAMALIVLPVQNISASAREASGDVINCGTAADCGLETDYMDLVSKILEDGVYYVMQVGAIYEQQRILEADPTSEPYEDTGEYTDSPAAEEVPAVTEDVPAVEVPEAEEVPAYAEEEGSQSYAYTDEDLDLLARIINAEAGCDWIPDWVQQMVGSVVINRVNSEYFPNTIREVIYQPGQYGPVYNGMIDYTPSQRVIDNARYVLENGSTCPSNVTGQNGEVSGGGVYTSYYDSILGTTIYFCYT